VVASEAVHVSAGVWLLSRALFAVLTYLGVVLFNDSLHASHPFGRPSFTHQFLAAWNRWDVQWYVDIAQRGYGWKKAAGTSPTAFFPLYPALVHVVGTLTQRSYLTAAMLVSNVAFFLALWYLWRLARWEIGRAVAGRTVLYVTVFPTALFFFAGYTESLFLWLTVASFYHLRRQDWLLAGAFGALASATRVSGVLLVLPLAYEYLRGRNFDLRRLDRGALGVVLVPTGLAAFMAYLALSVGDAMAFTQSQAAWQKIFTPWIWSGFLESLRQILEVQPAASFFEVHNVINVTIGGLFLVLSFVAARRLGASYGLYLAAFWLVTLVSPAMANGYPVPLISLSRYVLALFPVFICLGIVGRRGEFHNAYMVLSTGILALFTIQFLTGGWII